MMPDGGVYHGREGVREFYSRWFGSWDHFHMEPERIIDAGDEVVALMEVRGKGRGSGAEVIMRPADVRRIEHGKVVRHVGYPVAADALEALGLRE
jgi:ketosteroid isomerase-like protein